MSNDNLRSLINQETCQINIPTINGFNSKFKVASLKLPNTISWEWTNKLVGEPPEVFVDEAKSTKVEQKVDTRLAVHDLMAYGSVALVPQLTFDGSKINITILKPGSFDYVINEAGEVIYFEYEVEGVKYLHPESKTIVQVNIKRVYEIDTSGVCWYQETIKGGYNLVGEVVALNDQGIMIPIISELPNASPIWLDAASQIKDANLTYAEMMLDIELSRKMLALPDRFIGRQKQVETVVDPNATTNAEYTISKTASKMPTLANSARVVRAMPLGRGSDEQPAGPQWYEGKFDPQRYLDTLNFQLHLISQNSFLGRRYLSYDKEAGILTATEIDSNDNTLAINRAALLPIISELYNSIYRSTYVLLGIKDIPKQFTIVHSDAIFDNQEKINNQMSLDAAAGILNKEMYLKKRYKLDDVEVKNWVADITPDPFRE